MLELVLGIAIHSVAWAVDSTPLYSKAATSSNCQQRTVVSEGEMSAFISTLSPAQQSALSGQLVSDATSIPASCRNANLAAAARCTFGDEKYLRLIYLLGKFNMNASHLQEMPKPRDQGPHSLLRRADVSAFSKTQLDLLIMTAIDASPYLLSAVKPIALFRTDVGASAAFINYYDRPVIGLNPAEDRFIESPDKIVLVHELCHAWAESHGHADLGNDWLKVSKTSFMDGQLPENLSDRLERRHRFRSTLFAKPSRDKVLNGEMTLQEYKKAMAAAELASQKYYASEYGRTNVAEDFADTCVAERYGVTEWNNPAPELKAKLKYMSEKVFGSKDFTSGCGATPSTGNPSNPLDSVEFETGEATR